jgi:hypothetical protein
MTTELQEKFVFKLRYRDLLSVVRVVGPEARESWWFRAWMRRYSGGLSRSEYQALMEARPRQQVRRVRDWGHDE